MHSRGWIEAVTVIEVKRNGAYQTATVDVDVRVGYGPVLTDREVQSVTALQNFLLKDAEGKRALHDLAQEEFNRPPEQRRVIDGWPAIARHLTAKFEHEFLGKRYTVLLMMRS